MQHMQRGMTIWGLMVVVAMVAFLALLVMRSVPVYLNQMKVANAVEKVAGDPENAGAGTAALRRSLQRYWDIERIAHLNPRDIRVLRGTGGEPLIQYDYEARVSLIHNIDLVFYFEDEVAVRSSQ